MAENDPRSIVGLLAILTARELDAQPGSVPLIRELRTALGQLVNSGGGVNALGEIDEERVKLLRFRAMSAATAGGRRQS